MKKIDISATIGILANVGVLIGILLLVYELGQNRDMMQAQTRNSISDQLVDMVFQNMDNPEFIRIRQKIENEEPLTQAESIFVRWHQSGVWRYRENVNYQYRMGLYEEGEYVAEREGWRDDINAYDILREMWCQRRFRQSVEFVAEVDSLLETPC